MIQNVSRALFILLVGVLIRPGDASGGPPQSTLQIIPKPAEVIPGQGAFVLTHATKVVAEGSNQAQMKAARYLIERLRAATGYRLALQGAAPRPERNFILLDCAGDEELGEEGYTIMAERSRIAIGAGSDPGFFYAVQTLLQLMPPAAFSTRPQKNVKWTIQCGFIRDFPRFAWRGMHLDVSRHFEPKEFIKTYIDMLAMHKMNVFHWHLTDDQGWRLEIRKYPRLTRVAAWRVDREDQPWNNREPGRQGEQATYGGFYTQEEVRELVQYAAERSVTIVPEIEMPAHATAALAAYPQFSCTGGPFSVPPGGVWPNTDIFCAGNDSTFAFLEDVLSEVMDLFPGKYIHMGGDEADKREWKVCPKCQSRIRQEGLKDESELQSYFVRRIERFLLSRGRCLMGWDEILEGGLAPEATVMSWRGVEGGVAAARQGHDAVMTPVSHCYFDYYQGKQDLEPLAIGGYTPLSKVYSYEPVPTELTVREANHILGAQANVWTEYVPTAGHVQYMSLPRMAALAEVVWSPKETRNWEDFAVRVEHLMKRYQAAGYACAKSAYTVRISAAGDTAGKRFSVSLSTEIGTPEIRYTLAGKDPGPASRLYVNPIPVVRTTTIKAGAFRNGVLLGKVSEQKTLIHKALFKPVKLAYPYEQYDGGGDGALTNGLRGSACFQEGGWQGFHQNDLDATVDLGKSVRLKKLTTTYLEDTNAWIFLPSTVEYLVSADGLEFTSVGRIDLPPTTTYSKPVIKVITRSLKNLAARFVRVRARNLGVVPEWHSARGEKAWLFVDEIVVE